MSKGQQEKQTTELDLCEYQILKSLNRSMGLICIQEYGIYMHKMFKEIKLTENMNKVQNPVNKYLEDMKISNLIN